MLAPENVLKSTKHVGKYEKPVIELLGRYFSHQGYEVIPHARFNVSWGSILSDLDMLMIMDKRLLTLVEVKSRKDLLSRARRQVARIQDYVDYAYVAIEMQSLRAAKHRLNLPHFAGVLVVDVMTCQVGVLKKAEWIRRSPTTTSISWLNKKCLSRMARAGQPVEQASMHRMSRKWELADHIKNTAPAALLRDTLKEIVVCGRECENCCPILKQEVERLA